MDLFKNAKWSILQQWSTGITSGVSGPYDTAGIENVSLICTVPQTTTSVTFGVQGSATTTAGDFQALSYNSTAISVASTVTGGIHLIQINKPHPSYRYLKTFVNSTGVSSQGVVIAIGTGTRVKPTTFGTTEVIGRFHCASPTT